MPTPQTECLERYTVDAKSGCWLWNGRLEYDGYARVWSTEDGRYVPAHRWVFERLRGPIADGKEMDHICRNKGCVNPDHLEPVTRAENQRRGDAAKLTWNDVRFIRAFYQPHHPEFGQRALGRMFGVSYTTISNIVKNISWVDDPALEGGQ